MQDEIKGKLTTRIRLNCTYFLIIYTTKNNDKEIKADAPATPLNPNLNTAMGVKIQVETVHKIIR